VTAGALVLLGLALAACAGGPPPPRAPGAAGADYFPLVPGARWTYELKGGLFSRVRLEVTALGERRVQGADGQLFLIEERLGSEVRGLEPSGFVGYGVADGYHTRIAAVDLDAAGRARVLGGEGVPLLPLDPRPGQRWSAESRVFDSRSRQHWTASVESAGRVSVPAGTFDEVIVVHSEQWDPGWSSDRPLNSYDDYYARGFGLIRSVSRNHATWWFLGRLDQRLLDVRFE